MSINGVGSYHVQNYDVHNRGRAVRGKSANADFMGKAISLSETSSDEKHIGITEEGDRGSFADNNMDYQRIISERRNEIYEKLKNGDTEASFQIGGSSFTEKEWDKLLSEVDDITEEMREAMREEHQKRFTETVEEKTVNQTENVDISKHVDTGSSEIAVSNFKQFETANYKIVPCNDGVYSCFNIYKNGENAGAYFYSDICIKRDSVTGTEVLLSENGTGAGMYNVIPVDEELKLALKGAMGVDELPTEELSGYSIRTHQGTGIQYVMRPGDEGKGGKVLLRNAADEARYNALAEEYFNRYPNLVSSQEYGRIYASLEICGIMERTATGIVKIGYDNISYNDNSDYKKNWSAMLTGDTWELLWEWLEENRSHMEQIDEFSTWGDIIDELGGSYERVWSDEEILQGYLNN